MKIKNKLRIGESVYYDTNYGTTEIGTIKDLNISIAGSEHLGRKFAHIATKEWKNGWPVMTTVTMSRISPIL